MKLYEMSDHEFETGGTVDNALKKAGYCDGARSVINDLGWWNRELGEVLNDLRDQRLAETTKGKVKLQE